MTKTSLLALLLVSFIVTAQADETAAPRHGFLVFSLNGVANYTLEPKGELHLRGKTSSGRIDDFVMANGRIYHMHRLLGKVTELDADLKPVQEGAVKSKTGIPYWLGAWDGGLLVLNDNAVVYLDASLKEVALLPLEPRRHSEITPVLSPEDFDIWEHRGYLLTNTGEVFVIPFENPKSAEPLRAAFRSDEGLSPEGQWIDTVDQTLNLLVKTSREEHDPKLKPGEWRLIKEQVVFTYDLKAPGAPALRNVVHEEREIHIPRTLDFNDDERHGGMIIDRMPPYRPEGPAKGTYIGIMSRTTPAYAEAFDGTQLSIVRLKSRGQYERQQVFRDAKGDSLWFLAEGGRRYVESDLTGHVLRLQPEPYAKLNALPELHEVYFNTLAY